MRGGGTVVVAGFHFADEADRRLRRVLASLGAHSPGSKREADLGCADLVDHPMMQDIITRPS